MKVNAGEFRETSMYRVAELTSSLKIRNDYVAFRWYVQRAKDVVSAN